MKSNTKRLLALILAAVLVCALLPVMALANEAEVIDEGSAAFATTQAAFNGKAVTFAAETGGEISVEIISCTPGYYVDIYEDGEWLTDSVGADPDTVSFEVTAGKDYEILICTYEVYSPTLYMAAAGNISYKVTFLSNGQTGEEEEPTEPVDPSQIPGASESNPKLITGMEWTFIEGGQTIWYLYDNYQNMMENGVYSMMLHVNSSVDYTVTYRGAEVPVDENGFVNFEMVDMIMQGKYLFSVTNNAADKAFFGIEVKERPVYVNNGDTLVLGTNNIVLDTSAVYTLYEFSPSKTGVYEITAAEGLVGHWGTAYNPVDNTVDKTNTLQWTCTAVGQSVMIGFTGAETTTATVVRSADYIPPEEIPWVMYENTYDFGYTLPEGDVQAIDLNDGAGHRAELGSDGFYHYGDSEGYLLVADLSAAPINIADAYVNGGLRAWLQDDSGNTITKTDYNEALYAYHQAGLVPVTEELATMLKELGQANGWWSAGGVVFPEAAPEDLTFAWLQLCGYLVTPDTGYTVSGAVDTANGGDAVVELWQDDVLVAEVVADGSYALEDVASGSYTLVVSKDGYASREYAVVIADADAVQDVAIRALGDVSGDGRVNIGDVARLYSHVRGTALITDEYMLACANMNGGDVNIGDVAVLYGAVNNPDKQI